MTSKCPCEKCGVNIEFPITDAGETVKCPDCGQLTCLVIKSANPTRNKLHFHAERFVTAAWILLILAGIVTGITILFCCLTDSDDHRTTALLYGGAVVGACLSVAAVLYVIGQIIHIRANTQRD